MTEDSKGKGKICFVCTRIDEALQEDKYERPPTYRSDELPSDSDDDSEDDGFPIDSGHPEGSDTISSGKAEFAAPALQGEICSSLQYSTKIHEGIFNSLVHEGFLDDVDEDQLQSHDRCDFFHCVSAYAAVPVSSDNDGAENNPFLKDFLQFEKSLAKVIVGNLNEHVRDALKELIGQQLDLIENMFRTKFRLARKAITAERRVLFIVKAEERIHKQLKDVVATSRISQLHKMIKEEKAACLEFLPQKARDVSVLVDVSVSSRNDQDMTAAKQVREYVSDKFNGRFKKRVRDHLPVLNVGETIERCAKTMQKEANESLEAVRLVSTVVRAAYRPPFRDLNMNKGLPLKLRIKRLLNAVLRRDRSEPYTKSWKEAVARDFLKSFDAKLLAEEYCADVLKTLEKAHSEFMLHVKGLENAEQAIKREALGQQREVRIKDGYELAAVFLKSLSFLDSLRHGVPQVGNQIGKGPTGTVHKCLEGAWGPTANVVVKIRKSWPPPVSREVWPASLYFSM